MVNRKLIVSLQWVVLSIANYKETNGNVYKQKEND
jgi:hypothetical protein